MEFESNFSVRSVYQDLCSGYKLSALQQALLARPRRLSSLHPLTALLRADLVGAGIPLYTVGLAILFRARPHLGP